MKLTQLEYLSPTMQDLHTWLEYCAPAEGFHSNLIHAILLNETYVVYMWLHKQQISYT